MKKIIIFLALSITMFAETVKVDVEYILSKHPKYETVKTELEKEKQRLQELLDTKQKDLNTQKAALDAKADKVTEQEAKDYYSKEEELQNFFSKAQNDLLTFKNQKMQALYTDVLNTMGILQKQKKYDAIVDQDAIFVGKDNIKNVSEEVITLLKGTEKISLN